jgi:nucleotide-binding universal stress UspA family protein
MYKTILVPIDLSEPSSWDKALPVAADLTRSYGAQLHAVTVIRNLDAIWKTQYSLSAYETMIADAEIRLAAVLSDAVPHRLNPRSAVRHGSVYGEILQFARDIGADLIVMASHRPEMKDYLIGANAARVVRHAVCSVLVVRES